MIWGSDGSSGADSDPSLALKSGRGVRDRVHLHDRDPGASKHSWLDFKVGYRLNAAVRSHLPQGGQQVVGNGQAGRLPVVGDANENQPGMPVYGHVVHEGAERLIDLVLVFGKRFLALDPVKLQVLHQVLKFRVGTH